MELTIVGRDHELRLMNLQIISLNGFHAKKKVWYNIFIRKG